MFDKYSKEAGKEQYLIPYFIAAHPGTSEEDMLELALWLKKNGFRADQVQAFLPSPMATATAMYHSGKNPLKRVTRTSEEVLIPKGLKVRRLHKAFSALPTMPRTGPCCARRCAAWVARISSATANITSSPRINRAAPAADRRQMRAVLVVRRGRSARSTQGCPGRRLFVPSLGSRSGPDALRRARLPRKLIQTRQLYPVAFHARRAQYVDRCS